MKAISNEAFSFKALFQPNNRPCAKKQQAVCRFTKRPLAAFLLAVPFPTHVPADVEVYTEAKWRILEMTFYWMQWAFIYAAACMVGLYLFFFIIGFCIEKLVNKKWKRPYFTRLSISKANTWKSLS
ncbi:hypothetical protein GXP67_35875 [Rhodocytophaga rosea]|uniref:Uncharacterized protein n=1 Tax=Rhodocytophaga rosea TaxID=2704465 RepID=A0A6C0GU04_9BACT|nr:hypothetical protein [Rhodocytophaga rosea]QHT71669.1 hypothetical protein GXP67_35875 [Rhodocytophaga rosea]